jgi:hypothetical protein
MKGALEGHQFTGPANPVDGIQAPLDEIQKSELEHVFHHWMKHVRWMLNSNGDHLHKQTFHHHHSSQVLFDRPLATTYWPLSCSPSSTF